MKIPRDIRVLLGLLLLAPSSPAQAQESVPSAMATPSAIASPTSVTGSSTRSQADDEMEKARELLRQGYYDSAVISYQKAIEVAPDYPLPYQELGKLMLERKNFSYALKMYSKLGDLEPDNVEWQEVLFGLYDAFGMPTEALRSGNRLLDLDHAQPEMIKRMAEFYKLTGKPLDQIAALELYARTTEVDAEFWNQVGDLYRQEGRPRDAIKAYEKALVLTPENSKSQTELAQAYTDIGHYDEAEVIFDELARKDPEDASHNTRLARLYALKGDDSLVRGRANTALEYYTRAEKLAPTVPEADFTTETTSSMVRPNGQSFNANAQNGAGAVGPRNLAGTIGGSLGDRKRKANLLLRPQYILNSDFGNQGTNDYKVLDNTVRVPVRGTELDLRLRYNYRDVSDPSVGSASRDFVYAGASYNFNRNWSATGYVGSYGLYSIQALYEGEKTTAGLLVEKDMYSVTPLALATEYTYSHQGAFGGVRVLPRLSVDGSLNFYQYNDNSDQTIYSIGPTYQILESPGQRAWQVSYSHSGETNTGNLPNPLLRFAPSSLNADSVGTEYTEVLTDWWRLRAGYYHTWVSDGSSSNTFMAGSDFQLWEGAWLGLHYVKGSFANGVIPNRLQSTNNDNDNLNVSFGVHF